jgi:UvrD-like helicase family protein
MWTVDVRDLQSTRPTSSERTCLVNTSCNISLYRSAIANDPTNGEFVKVRSLDGGAIHLEDGRTLPANYREFTHGYAVTAHRSQGKTVDTVIISAHAMKKELFYVAASRGRTEIAVVTSDREQLRESVGVSTMRQSAIELARKQLSPHTLEIRSDVNLTTGLNRHAGQQIGEQHLSVPTHAPELEGTSHGDLDHDLGGLGFGLGR